MMMDGSCRRLWRSFMYKELKAQISWKYKTEPKLVLRLFPALKLQRYGPVMYD
ncbi:hypothetical protein AAG906_009658 [Vitis piasezkii]